MPVQLIRKETDRWLLHRPPWGELSHAHHARQSATLLRWADPPRNADRGGAGAGIRGGAVYGASDAQAAFVKDKPVSTGDICATIYECLGIDPELTVQDRSGRPVPVAHGGRPIRDILA